MSNISIWKAFSPDINFPALEAPLDVDVAIIGGGITGIMSAYLLSKSGHSVAVLEANKIAEGSTGYSTGNLYVMVDRNLSSFFSDDTAKKVAGSRGEAIDLIEKTVNDFHIDCDFKRVPWYLYSLLDELDPDIDDERKKAHDIGLENYLQRNILPFPVKASLVIPNQAQFNPASFVKILASKIISSNCHIYENTIVKAVDEGETCTIHTAKGIVKAKNVIMATHTPKGIMMVQAELAPYREYGVAAKIIGKYPEPGIYWSTEKPHHSLRVYENDGEKYLVIIGEKHKTGQNDDTIHAYKAVEDFLRAQFDVSEILYRWSAQSYRSADSLPFIGSGSKGHNIFIATGFATDGLVYGTLAAQIISDEINGVKKPMEKFV